MTSIQIGFLVIIILAICEAVKFAGVKHKYIPLLSVFLGLLGAMIYGGPDFLSAGAGIIIGLSTTGSYRILKDVATGVKIN